MKILIGTPVHQVKDYCMEKWIANVAKLLKITPADLLLVDNSPNLTYMKRVEDYCKKHEIKNYKIIHLELPEPKKDDDIDNHIHERVARSREVIRKYVLAHNYDTWFCWECDQIIPANALDKLIELMEMGNFTSKTNIMMINHNNWTRETPPQPNTDLGVSLITRECLNNYSFIINFGSEPEVPDNWISGDPWYKKQVLRDGGSYIEVYGTVDPIYHI